MLKIRDETGRVIGKDLDMMRGRRNFMQERDD
jgi:hypothetical protein